MDLDLLVLGNDSVEFIEVKGPGIGSKTSNSLACEFNNVGIPSSVKGCLECAARDKRSCSWRPDFGLQRQTYLSSEN